MVTCFSCITSKQRLCTLAGAVDLVGQQQVGEHRPSVVPRLAGLLVVDARARRSAGTRSGVNWMRRKVPCSVGRQRTHGERLGRGGHAFDQQVPLGQPSPPSRAPGSLVLATTTRLTLVQDTFHQLAGFGGVGGAGVGSSWHAVAFRGDVSAMGGGVRTGAAHPRRRRSRSAPRNRSPMKCALVAGVQDGGDDATTWPSSVTNDPPGLPGLAAASGWIRLLGVRLPSKAAEGSLQAGDRPGRAEGPDAPNGNRPPPPGRRAPVAVERKVAASGRRAGSWPAAPPGRPWIGSSPPRLPDSVPSQNVTLILSAPATTCRLVRISPVSTMTTPVPAARPVVVVLGAPRRGRGTGLPPGAVFPGVGGSVEGLLPALDGGPVLARRAACWASSSVGSVHPDTRTTGAAPPYAAAWADGSGSWRSVAQGRVDLLDGQGPLDGGGPGCQPASRARATIAVAQARRSCWRSQARHDGLRGQGPHRMEGCRQPALARRGRRPARRGQRRWGRRAGAGDRLYSGGGPSSPSPTAAHRPRAATVSRSVGSCMMTAWPSLGDLRWVDTHCHLDAPGFDADRAEVAQRAR